MYQVKVHITPLSPNSLAHVPSIHSKNFISFHFEKIQKKEEEKIHRRFTLKYGLFLEKLVERTVKKGLGELIDHKVAVDLSILVKQVRGIAASNFIHEVLILTTDDVSVHRDVHADKDPEATETFVLKLFGLHQHRQHLQHILRVTVLDQVQWIEIVAILNREPADLGGIIEVVRIVPAGTLAPLSKRISMEITNLKLFNGLMRFRTPIWMSEGSEGFRVTVDAV